MQTRAWIAFKFGTHQKRYRAHVGTNFGLNATTIGRNTKDFLCKVTPIMFLHLYGKLPMVRS